MFECSIENEYGQRLELTGNADYTVYKIDGLDPPDANINISAVANADGGMYNSSMAKERNIVIYLAIERNCEENRINLYKYAKSKRYLKFYYKNSSRDVYADGYVESIQIDLFGEKQNVQISIICPNPYFKSLSNSDIDFSNTEPLFVFPFAYEESGAPFSEMHLNQEVAIVNGGDIENGAIFSLRAIGTVLNPTVYNFTTNEYFKLNLEMSEGDEIIINTNRLQKAVTRIRNGSKSNMINYMDRGSTWLQLLTGDNLFGYEADEYSQNLLCTMSRFDEYEGV